MLSEKLKDILKVAKGLTANSKEVREGYIFFAIRGTRYDGHEFVKEALERGALACVVERDLDVNPEKIIKVSSTRKALGESASLFFGEPSKKLKVIGVTGTNGKTSTTYILERILSEEGVKTGVIGTINYRVGDKILGEGRTTPDPILWHGTLKKMLEEGAEFVCAEVSSHALDQMRVWGTRFFAVIFTNLSHDHLDYHGDMENYFLAKRRLFTEYEYEIAVINADDSYGERLIKELPSEKVITFGRGGDVKVLDFRTGFEGSYIKLSYGGKEYIFTSNLVGDFQAYNIAASVSLALRIGISPESIRKALQNVYIPGRFEVIRTEHGITGVIDYAHTPEAMENVLKTLKKIAGGRIITVFGAGGNRDREKRPKMGSVAEKFSDMVIVTSDNPRYEDPVKIIEDILKGIKDMKKVIVEPDRRKAIEKAVSIAKEGDVVAILGKGHETYQEIEGKFYPFSDIEVFKETIERR